MSNLKVEALVNADIKIERGDFVSIVGASGSGKSTLLHLIGCLDNPTSGKLFIEGVDVSKLDPDRLARIRREKIGFIFQKYNLIPTLNAKENVALAMSFAGMKSKDRLERSEYLLGIVELNKRMDHKPSELSGGEQQRVAIARALANNPSILLADEPTGNVDTKAGHLIMSILEEINNQGETVIVVTHDPDVANRAHRYLKIHDGEVREVDKGQS